MTFTKLDIEIVVLSNYSMDISYIVRLSGRENFYSRSFRLNEDIFYLHCIFSLGCITPDLTKRGYVYFKLNWAVGVVNTVTVFI